MENNTHTKHKKMSVNDFFTAIRDLEGTVYAIDRTSKFKKSVELAYLRNLDLEKLKNVIHTLAKGEKLPNANCPHRLKNTKTEIWECHISPDWLLLWQQNESEFILLLLDTGTHSDLF